MLDWWPDGVPRPDRAAWPGWRRAGRLALVVVVVLSFAWGGVRLADPMPKSPEMRTVDGSASPERIAYDAMKQTEEGNYEFTLWFGNATDRERQGTVRVDTADRQFETVGSSTRYGSEAGQWRRSSTDGEWVPSAGGWPRQVIFESRSAVLEPGADVSLVARNESTVVVRVQDTATVTELLGGRLDGDGERASLTLVVDREQGVLERSIIRRSWLTEEGNESSRRTSVDVREYRRWGEVDVRRPAGLPYGFANVFQDLQNDCGGCEEGDG